MTLAINGWIEVSEPGTRLVLKVGGELDTASREVIEPAVMAAIVSAPAVILDLAQLSFCDSRGIAMFIAAQEMADAEATELMIRNPSRPVRRLFEITGLDRVLRITA